MDMDLDTDMDVEVDRDLDSGVNLYISSFCEITQACNSAAVALMLSVNQLKALRNC
jgi:hypothetical protein